VLSLRHSYFSIAHLQGVSGAGCQWGLLDQRTSLIKSVFDVYDALDEPERRVGIVSR